jgi:hypothetical protein
MISPNREYRTFEFETGEMRATGVPVVFNSPTVMYRVGDDEYFEVVDARAFDGADISVDARGQDDFITNGG